jgi:hypothetical protein
MNGVLKGITLHVIGRTFALPAIVAIGFISACSGGSVTTPRTSSASSNEGGTFALSITIPQRTSSASVRRSTYISASTQSMSVQLMQGSTVISQQAIGLTPSTNPNCASSAGTVTCMVSINAGAGTYTGTFATYDGLLTGGATTGSLLSSGQSIPVVVVPGQTNTVAVTLDGVPASLSIAPTSGSAITGTQGGGFSVKYSPQPLLVEALDADNNIILGPGAPTFTATATATKFTVSNPTGGSPNQITLAAAAGGTGTLTVTAAPPDGGFSCATSGIVCVASAPISTPAHELFTMTNTGLRVYTSPDDVTWTQTVTNTSGAGSATTIDVAPNGTLAVVTSGNQFARPPVLPNIAIYSAPYTAAPAVNTHVTSPFNALFTQQSVLLVGTSSTLVELASPYTGSPTTLASIGSQIYGIALDSSGDAIVATMSAASIYSAPSYNSAASVDSTTGYKVAIATDGTLAIGSSYPQNIVTLYHPPYTGGAYATITLPNQGGPGALAFDSNGGLWVLEPASHCLRYSAPFSTGQSALFDVVNNGGYVGLATDSSGDALVTDSNTATVTIINGSGMTVGSAGTGYEMKYVR